MNSRTTRISDSLSRTATRSHSAITFTNIRGLNRNIDSVHHFLETSSPLIFFLTETQISPSGDHTHLLFPNYSLFPCFLFKAGVCAYVHNSALITHLPDLDVSNREFQFLWLKLRASSFNHYFCVLYRSPNSPDCSVFDLLSLRIENILQSDSNAQITILGDFNVHNTDWLAHSASTTTLGREAEAFAVINNLSQLVTFPTRVPDRAEEHAHTLDLLLTSNPSLFSDLSQLSPLGSSDHCLISFSIQTPTASPTLSSRRTFWRYESADWCGFRDFLASYPWRDCVLSSNPSTSAVNVAEVILQGMNMFIPHFSKPGKKNSPEWFNHACSRAVRQKKNAFRRWCSAPSPSSHHCYVQARNKCSAIIQKVKEQFVRRKADKLANCPSGSRSFWSLAKAVSRNFCPSSFPSIMNPSDDLVSDPSLKADVFASLFASNSTLPPCTTIPTTTTHHGPTFHPNITTRNIRLTLRSLDVSKPPGPDGIPPIVLKSCAPELAPILRILFSHSLSSGVFPNCWKNAHVFPIPKRGATCDPNNYRPISLTSTLSKVFELVIAKQLRSHLERQVILSDRQYGFRSHRSTGDLLAYVSHIWSSTIDHHGESHLVSLDISKAFDRVWHDGLLAKLPTFGFSSNFTSWIRSFLSDRSISVRVDGVLSSSLPVNSGVPQGSVLSPSLFLLFINDLLSLTSCPIHAFADDTTLHCSLSYDSSRACSTSITHDRATACASLNADLGAIGTWGVQNRVVFNASKTSYLSVSRKRILYAPNLVFDSVPLRSTPSSVLLGLQFSSSLSWSPHIFELASRASKKISYLFRARRFYTPSQLLTLYKAQIRPTLEYCSHVWGGAPSSSLSLLDRIQRKAIRLIADATLTSNLQPLSHRRAVSSLSLFYRYYHGFCSSELAAVVPLPLTFQRESRTEASSHPYQVSLEACRTTAHKSSFFPRTAIMWNTLPYSVFPSSYNLSVFKSRINKLSFS